MTAGAAAAAAVVATARTGTEGIARGGEGIDGEIEADSESESESEIESESRVGSESEKKAAARRKWDWAIKEAKRLQKLRGENGGGK
jgi:hypothetical protein